MAIVVALSALMLMAFGALAVDLGNAWARKRAIQTSADLAALAGAGGLPSTLDARRAAIDYLRRNPVQGASLAACTLTTWSTPCWDNDSDETNGEIEFFDDTDNDGRVEFDANHDGNRVDTEQVTSASATVIRVVPPGHRVDFGLAGAVGFDSVDVTEPATARIGSAFGLGTPPFFLTTTDFGNSCLKDSDHGNDHNDLSVIPSWGLKAVTSGSPITVTPTTALPGATVTISGLGFQNNDTVFFGTTRATSESRVNASTMTAVVPYGTAAASAPVHVESNNGNNVSQTTPFSVIPPTLSSVTPSPADTGAAITLTGSGLPFGPSDTASSVYFDTQPVTAITTKSASTWTLDIPTSLVAGNYQLRIHQGGLVSNAVTLQVQVPPTPLPHIASLSPTSGPIGTQVTLSGANFPGTGTVLFGTQAAADVGAHTATSWKVLVPTLPAPSTVAVTIAAPSGSSDNSRAFDVTVDPNACTAVTSNRGYIDEPRSDVNSQFLEFNIKRGVDHNLHNYKIWPTQGAPRTITIGSDCDSPGVVSSAIVREPTHAPYLSDINCAHYKSGDTNGAVKKGFFDDPDGRLMAQTCGTTIPSGPRSGADQTDFFTTQFIDTAKGSIAAFQAAASSGSSTPTPGWVKDTVFDCPRFGIVPVINIDVNTDNGVDKDYPIVGFRAVYFWDTTPDHGFLFQGNSLRQIRGFVFDLDYLPTEVSASLAGGVGPYLGEGPKVIQLVHDPSDPAT